VVAKVKETKEVNWTAWSAGGVAIWILVGGGMLAYATPKCLSIDEVRQWSFKDWLTWTLAGMGFILTWPFFLIDWMMD
jgi:hypothetical protein